MIHNLILSGVLLLTILFFGAATKVFAVEGDLDATFGGDGIVVTDNDASDERVVDLTILPDGKIIALGYSQQDAPFTARSILVCYNSDGSIDTTFGSGGKVIIQSVVPSKMALQTNGKIVVVGRMPLPAVGSEGFNGDFYVARLNSDGNFDATFKGIGFTTVDFRGNSGDAATSVKIQPDGKIVVGGTVAANIEKMITVLSVSISTAHWIRRLTATAKSFRGLTISADTKPHRKFLFNSTGKSC